MVPRPRWSSAVGLLVVLATSLSLSGCGAFQLPSSSSPPPVPAVGDRRSRQTLTFPDARTGITVHLVGSMHYNPYSIAKASSIVRSYGEAGSLGSVVVEQCPARWEKVTELHPRGTVLRAVLDNEMQAAAEAGEAFGTDVVLGDEKIETVDARVKEAFLETAKDLANPLGGGWAAIASDIRTAYSEAIDPARGEKDGVYLSALDLLDPKLLLASPLSFLRYPLAIVIKAPLLGAALISLLTFLTINGPAELAAEAGGLADMSLVDILVEMVEGAAAFTLETVILARIFLTVLLVERNEVLARNIRAECIRLADEGKGLFGRKSNADKVCVAVLGMAHCNGVKSLLMDEK